MKRSVILGFVFANFCNTSSAFHTIAQHLSLRNNPFPVHYDYGSWLHKNKSQVYGWLIPTFPEASSSQLFGIITVTGIGIAAVIYSILRWRKDQRYRDERMSAAGKLWSFLSSGACAGKVFFTKNYLLVKESASVMVGALNVGLIVGIGMSLMRNLTYWSGILSPQSPLDGVVSIIFGVVLQALLYRAVDMAINSDVSCIQLHSQKSFEALRLVHVHQNAHDEPNQALLAVQDNQHNNDILMAGDYINIPHQDNLAPEEEHIQQIHEHLPLSLCQILSYARDPSQHQLQDLPSGIVLYGPSGHGKTYTVECLAGSLERYRVPVFRLAVSSLCDQEQKLVRINGIFDQLAAHAEKNDRKLAVVFCDNIETCGDEKSATMRTFVERLQDNMERIAQNKNVKVICILATNKPQFLPSSLRSSNQFFWHELFVDASILKHIFMVELLKRQFQYNDNNDIKTQTSQMFDHIKSIMGMQERLFSKDEWKKSLQEVFSENGIPSLPAYLMKKICQTYFTDDSRLLSAAQLEKMSNKIFTFLRNVCSNEYWAQHDISKDVLLTNIQQYARNQHLADEFRWIIQLANETFGNDDADQRFNRTVLDGFCRQINTIMEWPNEPLEDRKAAINLMLNKIQTMQDSVEKSLLLLREKFGVGNVTPLLLQRIVYQSVGIRRPDAHEIIFGKDLFDASLEMSIKNAMVLPQIIG